MHSLMGCTAEGISYNIVNAFSGFSLSSRFSSSLFVGCMFGHNSDLIYAEMYFQKENYTEILTRVRSVTAFPLSICSL